MPKLFPQLEGQQHWVEEKRTQRLHRLTEVRHSRPRVFPSALARCLAEVGCCFYSDSRQEAAKLPGEVEWSLCSTGLVLWRETLVISSSLEQSSSGQCLGKPLRELGYHLTTL